MKVPVEVVGPPEWYCPDCKRLLYSCNEDGTFNIQGKAGLTLSGSVFFFDPEDPEPIEAFATDAQCLQLKCRLKRWVRRIREP